MADSEVGVLHSEGLLKAAKSGSSFNILSHKRSI